MRNDVLIHFNNRELCDLLTDAALFKKISLTYYSGDDSELHSDLQKIIARRFIEQFENDSILNFEDVTNNSI